MRILANGTLVTPEGLRHGDVALDGDKIARIAAHIEPAVNVPQTQHRLLHKILRAAGVPGHCGGTRQQPFPHRHDYLYEILP